MKLAELRGARVAVWGLGREGRAALGALRRHLPGQGITALCNEREADEAHAADGDGALRDVRFVTRPPDAATLAQFDVVVKSPGISPYKPPVPQARAAGVRFTSGTALWFGENPDARVIGVTGTKGKSTTSAVLAHCARALGVRTALAGNIGLPLLELVGQSAELWVVELSSFQTGEAGALEVGVVTNLYEEHLDWHLDAERYARDKLRIADVARTLVVDAAQPGLLARTHAHPARRLSGAPSGWHVAGAAICKGAAAVLPLSGLPLAGAHNAHNVCAALTALDAAGMDARSAAAALHSFQPLPHRLQWLGERDGLGFVNDSIATTPHATIEALRSLHGRDVVVLVGGFDRGVDWQAFFAHVATHPVHAIVCSGANGARIATALRQISGAGFALAEADTLQDAFARAVALAPRGGVVLLSPGAPSFDQFSDYAERGRAFARMAGFDASRISAIQGLGIA